MIHTRVASVRRVRRLRLRAPVPANDDMQVGDFPLGYPRLASYIHTDIDGRIYRQFGRLRNRLLLHRQDELMCLSDEMDDLDKADNDAWSAT